MDALNTPCRLRLALPLCTYVSLGLETGMAVTGPTSELCRSGLEARLVRRLGRLLDGLLPARLADSESELEDEDGWESVRRREDDDSEGRDRGCIDSSSSEFTQSSGVLSPEPGACGKCERICASRGEVCPEGGTRAGVLRAGGVVLVLALIQGFETRIVAASGRYMFATLSRTCAL